MANEAKEAKEAQEAMGAKVAKVAEEALKVFVPFPLCTHPEIKLGGSFFFVSNKR